MTLRLIYVLCFCAVSQATGHLQGFAFLGPFPLPRSRSLSRCRYSSTISCNHGHSLRQDRGVMPALYPISSTSDANSCMIPESSIHVKKYKFGIFLSLVAAGVLLPVCSIAHAASAVVGSPAGTSMGHVLQNSLRQAFHMGGLGAFAAIFQVFGMMWLRTTVNYQYKKGVSTTTALWDLYQQGGIPRFYQGLPLALVETPLLRFGNCAANQGTLVLLASFASTASLPMWVKTMFGTILAASWRVCLGPLDTWKTIVQVEGNQGWPMLKAKVKQNGLTVLFHGVSAAAAATLIGHYFWFCTHNIMEAVLPAARSFQQSVCRNALVGFSSSFVADISSNSIRVVKTVRQTSDQDVPYRQVVHQIVQKDGVLGLFCRGLGTRIIMNGMQGMIFNVIWKFMQ